jgi:transposase-like protein
MTYTDEQKAEAVRLYVEVGAEEAAETVGCSRRQVYRWLGSHNVTAKTNDDRRAETQTRHAEKREELRNLLLDQAVDALHRMNEAHVEYRQIGGREEQVVYEKAAPADWKSYATAAAILIDKYRLEMGEATGKTESITLTAGLLESEIMRLEHEVGKQAPANI